MGTPKVTLSQVAIKHLTNKIRNGNEVPRNVATALESVGDSLNILNQFVGTLAGSGSVTPVPPPTPETPPDDVTGITVTGTVDQSSGIITLSVGVTPPSPLGTFIGGHEYLEIPDQSANASLVVGTSTVGGPDAVTGTWRPIDCGKQPYVLAQQPWTVQAFVPPGIDITQAIPCRLRVVSYSNAVENTLVQSGTGVTPSQTFMLIPTNAGGNTPSSGSGVTALVPGPIVATVLAPDNSTGKLMTPVLVDLSTVPGSKWVGRLVLTIGNADATQTANQQVVSGIITQAGPVYESGDGIATPHSFTVQTPTTITSGLVWLQSGTLLASGSYQWNNIVPAITPQFPITYGSTTGVNDASAVMLSTINSAMAVVNGLFGVAPSGITNSFLGSGAVATINVQNLAITNPLLASLVVDASKLATGAVTATKIGAAAVGTAAIQNAAITNALIANLAVSGAQIQSATITGANIANATIAGANIGTATITDANIANLSASKVTAGAFIGSTMTLTSSGVTTSLSNVPVGSTIYGISVEDTAYPASGTNQTGLAKAGIVISTAGTVTVLLDVVSGTPTLSFLDLVHGFMTLSASELQISSLPSSSPGAGSKQLWYDPSDSNRVKFAA